MKNKPSSKKSAGNGIQNVRKKVIEKLALTREYWQTKSPFVPTHKSESVEARYQRGKALREKTPRESHAAWAPDRHRPNPLELIQKSNVGRVESLVPLRMARMADSPFTFLRGSAVVMARDLALTPISGLQAMIDGDAHINNFGLYGTPQRDVIIDINDFDETTIGPWEWDLKRLVASVNVACRDNGFSRNERRDTVLNCMKGYATNAHRLKTFGIYDTWSIFAYADLERDAGALEAGVRGGDKFRAILKKVMKKALVATNARLLEKVTREIKGEIRFIEDPPVITRVDASTKKKIIQSLVQYADTLSAEYRFMLPRYSVADVCHRVVGVGSVGLRAYLVLLLGAGQNDPLFLQFKQAAPSAHSPYLPQLGGRVDHEGHRVVTFQRGMQALGDPLLGYTTIDKRPYFVRQMKNLKASMPIEFLSGDSFEFWAWCCGALLARAHARTGDIAAIAGYIGSSTVFHTAMADFAETYGNQTVLDHATLTNAIRSGRVPAVELI